VPRKELEATGQRYERWSTITLAAGLAAAAGAAALWVLDAREAAAAPLVGPGLIGAAATVRF
jgi:hypothetical protein